MNAGLFRTTPTLTPDESSCERGPDGLTAAERNIVKRGVAAATQRAAARRRRVVDSTNGGGPLSIDLRTAHDAVTTDKEAFTRTYDFGNPVDAADGRSNHRSVLILRDDGAANNGETSDEQNNHDGPPHYSNPVAATRGCELMNVIITQGGKRTCTAFVGAGDVGGTSYHMQHWKKSTKTNNQHPIRSDRSEGKGNRIGEQVIKSHEQLLRTYLQHLDAVLEELRPIAAKAANKRNEIVVLTSNLGQASLLLNFVCNARSQSNADEEDPLSNILVFPTDRETHDLAVAAGLASFYDERNFGHLPVKEARSYGDRTFTRMMYAKVVCVQLVNALGYHVLFQDVDVVWRAPGGPLDGRAFDPWPDFDLLFQDDGAHSLRYAPWSANTGFYYVRYNDRTRYFLTQLLYNGALIQAKSSHQAALIAVMNEHASLFGLRVKTLDGTRFPGGFHYHRRKEQMKDIVRAEQEISKTKTTKTTTDPASRTTPWIFHMSWTANKDNKLLFFRQMGWWYLKDRCVDRTLSKIALGEGENLTSTCCSGTKPLFSCHYRDKPSAEPCKNSPPIDPGRRSFW